MALLKRLCEMLYEQYYQLDDSKQTYKSEANPDDNEGDQRTSEEMIDGDSNKGPNDSDIRHEKVPGISVQKYQFNKRPKNEDKEKNN